MNSGGGTTNTIPVTIRTLATPGAAFNGVLTGGNGRGNPAVQSTYAFKVPAGKKDIDVGVIFNDVNDGVVAFLQNPQGNNVAQASNLYQGAPLSNTVNVYKDHPAAGTWTLVLDWLQPVSGTAINTPFVAKVDFNKVSTSNNLPTGATIPQGSATGYTVHYTNTSPAPQLIFLDPRQSTSDWTELGDLLANPEPFPLPTVGFSNPIYMVPPDSTKLFASLDATAPVTFDFDPWTGDPTCTPRGHESDVHLHADRRGVTPGFWGMFPSEVGPFGPSGADTSVTATADFQAYTPLFDPTVATDTGDLWSYFNGYSASFNPIEVDPGDTVALNVSITPTAAVGTTVTRHDQPRQHVSVQPVPRLGRRGRRDQLASIPYSYKVGP